MRIYDFERENTNPQGSNEIAFIGNPQVDNTDFRAPASALLGNLWGLRDPEGNGFVGADRAFAPLNGGLARCGYRRQAIWQGQNFLEASGLDINLKPITLSIADGWDEEGDRDYIHAILSDVPQAWTVPENGTYYLWIQHESDNSLTFGYTAAAPSYSFWDDAPNFSSTDLVAGATEIWASSFHSTLYLPSLVGDNNSSTYWQSRGAGREKNQEWIAFDWGQNREVRMLRFLYNPNSWNNLPHAMRYEVSDDKVHWKPVYDYVLDARYNWGNANRPCVFFVPSHTPTRYGRLIASGDMSGTGSLAITEIKAFEANYPEEYHYFSPRTMKMRVHEGGVATYKPRIIVGEVLSSAGAIVSAIPYALNGRTELSFMASTHRDFTLPHNLGCAPIHAQIYDAYGGYRDDGFTSVNSKAAYENWDVANNRPDGLMGWQLETAWQNYSSSTWHSHHVGAQITELRRSFVRIVTGYYPGGRLNTSTSFNILFLKNCRLILDRGW